MKPETRLARGGVAAADRRGYNLKSSVAVVAAAAAMLAGCGVTQETQSTNNKSEPRCCAEGVDNKPIPNPSSVPTEAVDRNPESRDVAISLEYCRTIIKDQSVQKILTDGIPGGFFLVECVGRDDFGSGNASATFMSPDGFQLFAVEVYTPNASWRDHIGEGKAFEPLTLDGAPQAKAYRNNLMGNIPNVVLEVPRDERVVMVSYMDARYMNQKQPPVGFKMVEEVAQAVATNVF